MRVAFGEWNFDSETRELVKEGRIAHLTPKAFELLQVLLEHRPKAIPKAAIRDRLWPATFVSESNLTSLVSELRTLLGDDARHPRFLRTVHGFGYAFCGEAKELPVGRKRREERPPPCRLLWEKREILLVPGENFLGRDPDSVVWLDSPEVSRRHALILVEGEEATLEDLGSRNGTFLNGEKIEAPVTLSDGDVVSLGGERMVFRAGARGLLGKTKPAVSGGEPRSKESAGDDE